MPEEVGNDLLEMCDVIVIPHPLLSDLTIQSTALPTVLAFRQHSDSFLFCI